MKSIALIGGGGHGKVCASIAEDLGYDVSFFDDAYPKVSNCGKWPVVGTSDDLISRVGDFDYYFVSIGNCTIRERIQLRLVDIGFKMASLVSSTASIHNSVIIGDGVLVVGNACINIDSKIANGVIINTNACIDHDCNISAFAHICPNVALAGEVFIGTKAWIGIGSTVIQQLSIGSGSLVGAGSIVIGDVAPETQVMGCPAKISSK